MRRYTVVESKSKRKPKLPPKPVKSIEPLSDRHGWVVNPMSKILLADMHNVYWGSHGCERRRGHANPCRCQCGEMYGGSHVYGEDAATAVASPLEAKRLKEDERRRIEDANQEAAESDSARNREV